MQEAGADFRLGSTVTCDILGPFNAPYAIAQVGYVPGVTLYVLFGAMAGLTGVMLQREPILLGPARAPAPLLTRNAHHRHVLAARLGPLPSEDVW